MAAFSFSKPEKSDMKRFCLNTGTQFDLATGKFLPGKNGLILNGGLNITNAFVGREQTFKSSIALGYFMRVLMNYVMAWGGAYDTEYSFDEDRLYAISGNPSLQLDERLETWDKNDMDMDGIFNKIKSIAEEKKSRPKDFIEETPFLNPATGKFYKSYIPTVLAIDSWTLMQSALEIGMYDKGVAGKTTNTAFMVDGNQKSRMMRQLPLICSQAGIYLILTAHVGDSIKMDPYAPVNKDLPHMRASDKIKGVGSQFNFLVSNLMETRKVALAQDSNKECFYPLEGASSEVELQEVTSVICRCKNNMSGGQVRHIISQVSGIQDTLDYHNLLRTTKSPALQGTVHQTIPILPEKKFKRQNIREMIRDDYEFRRAMDIIGQFEYICNNWNIPEFKQLGVMKFSELLMASGKASVSDILNSVGTWTFNSVKRDRKYLSIFDIVDIALGKRKA